MIRDHIILRTPFDAVRSAALQKLQPSLDDVLLIGETFETTTKTVAVLKEENEKHIPVNIIRSKNQGQR